MFPYNNNNNNNYYYYYLISYILRLKWTVFFSRCCCVRMICYWKNSKINLSLGSTGMPQCHTASWGSGPWWQERTGEIVFANVYSSNTCFELMHAHIERAVHMFWQTFYSSETRNCVEEIIWKVFFWGGGGGGGGKGKGPWRGCQIGRVLKIVEKTLFLVERLCH